MLLPVWHHVLCRGSKPASTGWISARLRTFGFESQILIRWQPSRAPAASKGTHLMRIYGEERIQIGGFYAGVLRGPISCGSAQGALMHRITIDPPGDPSPPRVASWGPGVMSLQYSVG